MPVTLSSKINIMKTLSKLQKSPWLPALLIIWNLIDIAVHIGVDMVEPLRISGNVIGIVAALLVMLGIDKLFTSLILIGVAIAVVILNVVQVLNYGVGGALMFIFIGGSLFLLLTLARVNNKRSALQE